MSEPYTDPAPIEMRSRFRGCLLGGAVGDALGAPVEFMSRGEIHRRFGPEGITEYVPVYGRLGAITDDTQMTLFTAEGLLQRGMKSPPGDMDSLSRHLGRAYIGWLSTQGLSNPNFYADATRWVESSLLIGHRELHDRRAPGNTCLTALQRMGSDCPPASNNSKGCGGVMRVAPVGLWADSPEAAFVVGCDAAALTHGHPTGWLSAGAFSVIIAMLVKGEGLYSAIQSAIALLVREQHHEETVAAIRLALDLAGSQTDPQEAIGNLGGGWIAEEALAISVYCALVATGFREAVVMAVNHSGDSDSTGSITGNLLGAMWGEGVIPTFWLHSLELHDVIVKVSDALCHSVRQDHLSPDSVLF